MTIRLSRDRRKVLLKESLKLSSWLDALPEYRRFYRGWRKQVREGKVLKYEIKRIRSAKGKAIYKVIIRPKDLTADEPEKISQSWIKKEKWKLQKRITSFMYFKQELWKKKLGFYPLVDPETGENFFRMYEYIKHRFGKGFYLPTVEVLNYSMAVVDRCQEKRKRAKRNPEKYPLNFASLKLPLIPSRLKIAVNYRESTSLIKEEVGKIVQNIKKEYGILQRTPQVDSELEFKASFLKRLGLPREIIKKRLTPEIKDRDKKNAFRNKLSRVLDNIFKTLV